MKIDKFGIASFDENDLIDVLLKNEDAENCLAEKSKDIELYNETCDYFGKNHQQLRYYQELDMSVEEFDRLLQKDWMIPEEYKSLNIREYCLNKCSSQEEIDRVNLEMDLYDQINKNDLLQCLVYLVDVMKQNNIVWGVGRGSSVASYCLFLIGIHRIDSLKYNLDIKEFIRT